ncbi:hypothetical protein BP00DRAFT_419790 [Aspergillus indologenus CBS 114.80]|uniref:Uncharacterized protein n=1 Tax=Aspergillus indologenus CBS 114.80 TaxID=1450541 RepID=A0A2V5IQT3_9EURO|nr:hypothetical protein BP00DRAFT_419790 [Aspergillus indologenus CBS 114.80]
MVGSQLGRASEDHASIQKERKFSNTYYDTIIANGQIQQYIRESTGVLNDCWHNTRKDWELCSGGNRGSEQHEHSKVLPVGRVFGNPHPNTMGALRANFIFNRIVQMLQHVMWGSDWRNSCSEECVWTTVWRRENGDEPVVLIITLSVTQRCLWELLYEKSIYKSLKPSGQRHNRHSKIVFYTPYSNLTCISWRDHLYDYSSWVDTNSLPYFYSGKVAGVEPQVGNPGGNSACAKWCAQNFPSNPGSCTSQAAKNGGPCFECGPLQKSPITKKLCSGVCTDITTVQNCGDCGHAQARSVILVFVVHEATAMTTASVVLWGVGAVAAAAGLPATLARRI